jgi:molecular chaperone DnaK
MLMENEILVGIDFGTTNTVISVFENNKRKVLKDGIFNTIPSKIGYNNNNLYCGNMIPINCNNIIHSFKISEKSVNIDNKLYSYSDLLIIFFQHIKVIITKYYPNMNIKAVITVPSNFNDMMREKIKSCFIAVGINVIRIINEPSAAALAYGLKHSGQENEKILVIDTGGGTMDFTILEKTELFFEVVHSEGLNDLGGNNFTNIIVDNMKKTIDLDNIPESIIWNQAQKIKEKLTYLDTYEIKINNNKYNLTKERFENLSNELPSTLYPSFPHLGLDGISLNSYIAGIEKK